MLKRLGTVWSLALLFGGCPKRQTTPRIVYIPTPPAAMKPTTTTAMLVIQEPEPTAPASPPLAPGATTTRRQSPARRKPPARPIHVEPIPVPALAPRENSSQQVALRDAILRSQQQVQQAIDRLHRAGLPENELSTLGGAQVFLAQSVRALQENDLQRALNLVRKAQLLVQALQGSP